MNDSTGIETKNGVVNEIPKIKIVRDTATILIFFALIFLMFIILEQKKIGFYNINNNILFSDIKDLVPEPILLSGTNLELYYLKDNTINIFNLSKVESIDVNEQSNELRLIAKYDNIYNFKMEDKMVKGFKIYLETDVPLFYIRLMRNEEPLWKTAVMTDGSNFIKKNNIYTVMIKDEQFLNWTNDIYYFPVDPKPPSPLSVS